MPVMLTARRLTTLPESVLLSPQQLLAGLRWLVVGAASVLSLRQGVMTSHLLREVLIIGALLGQQSFALWLALRKDHVRHTTWLLLVNVAFISVATALLGINANSLFLLFPILLVDGVFTFADDQMLFFTMGTVVAYASARIIGTPGGVFGWLHHDWVLTVLEILLLVIVTGISANITAVWKAEHQHIVQLALLDDLALLLADTRKLDDALARLVEIVPDALQVQACVIVIDEPGSDRRIWANLGADTSAMIDEALLEGRTTKAQHRVISTSHAATPYTMIYSLPLAIDDRSVGLLSIARHTPEPFSQRDRRIFESLARHATQSLRNARLYKLEAEAASQSRELERFKSEMLASVSHEFRLPLASISLAAETLLARPGGDDLEQRLLHNIYRSTHRLNGFVQDVLDVARLDANQLELRMEDHDIVALARTVVEHMIPQCEMKGQRLSFETMLDSCLVHGDGKRLEQVLSNLLTNAQQYTPEGGEIVLSLASAELMHGDAPRGIEGTAVAICVRDTGPGIPLAERSEIFTRFNRGTAGKRRSAGAGLGLHIAQSVVELHGGSLWMAGNAQGGSSFWCVLPRAASAEPTANTSFPTGLHVVAPLSTTDVVVSPSGAPLRQDPSRGGAE